jgi:cyclophilin family peptidyl-prolyl cis-trans isomerase
MDKKIILTFLLIAALTLVPIVSGVEHNHDKNLFNNKLIINDNKTFSSNPKAFIQTTMGAIIVELYRDLAPNTVDNFIKLANDGFYEGLVFHRVIDDFVVQGGGYYPDGNPKQSPYGSINLEIHPDARHVDGAIAMARYPDPNSATSQFYICDGPQPSLDDDYAVFGKVTVDTISTVRDIAEVFVAPKYGHNHWPEEDIIIEYISIYEYDTDIDVIFRGGFGGFNIKLRNKNPEDYERPISFYIVVEDATTQGVDVELYRFDFVSTDTIPANRALKVKTIHEGFMFGLKFIRAKMSVDFDDDGKGDVYIRKLGLLIGPFVILLLEW